jgi:hypothetical protein
MLAALLNNVQEVTGEDTENTFDLVPAEVSWTGQAIVVDSPEAPTTLDLAPAVWHWGGAWLPAAGRHPGRGFFRSSA